MSLQIINDNIFEIRGQKVMLDFDLAAKPPIRFAPFRSVITFAVNPPHE